MKRITILSILLAIWTLAVSAQNNGHFWMRLGDKHIAMDEAVSKISEWQSVADGSTFQLLRDETDALGMRHMRYRQWVNGVEVQGSAVMVHGRDGVVTSVNGVVMEQQTAPVQVRSTINRAKSKASGGQKLYFVQTTNGYRYATLQYDFAANADVYVDCETGEVLKSLPRRHAIGESTMQGRSLYSGTVPLSVTRLADDTHLMTDSTRRIYTLNALTAIHDNPEPYRLGTTDDGTIIYDRHRYIAENCPPLQTTAAFWLMPQLVEVSLDSICPQADPFAEVYMVLRNSRGEIVNTTPLVYAHTLPSSVAIKAVGGESAFYNIKDFSIETWLYQYTGDDIRLDSIALGPFDVGTHCWKTEQTAGRVSIAATGHPAVDVHWGMQQTYDWYKHTLGRDSYDGHGAPIYNILFAPRNNFFIGMSTGNNNAFADFKPDFGNGYVMEYGIGDGVMMRPVVSLDVMAHEFTHLVTRTTANLEYIGESGALNESFSDIIGICVKHAVKGSKVTDNWLIGDDVMLTVPCMRDMSHRVTGMAVQPIYYKGSEWDDHADVHVNSGVQNFWYYVLSEGGEFPDVESEWGEKGLVVFGIGEDKAVQIAYRNLTHYLCETSCYADARQGSMQAAIDLYGDSSKEYDAVNDAWRAVGITDETPTVTAIPTLRREALPATDVYWYTLQGQRISGKPSQPGIYIRNGKKIIIK